MTQLKIDGNIITIETKPVNTAQDSDNLLPDMLEFISDVPTPSGEPAENGLEQNSCEDIDPVLFLLALEELSLSEEYLSGSDQAGGENELKKELLERVEKTYNEHAQKEADEFQKKWGKDEKGNYRAVKNGHWSRKLNTFYGVINLKIQSFKMPEGVKERFYPSFLNKHQYSESALINLVKNLLSYGVSTRALEDVFADMGISGFSRSSCSRRFQELQEKVEAFMTRRFDDEEYLDIQIDGLWLCVRIPGASGQHYRKVLCLRIIGLNAQTGYWEHLDVAIGLGETADFVRERLQDLKARGLKLPAFSTSDNGSGILSALSQEMPFVIHICCDFHEKQAVLRNVPKRVREEFAEAAVGLYDLTDKEELSEAMEQMERDYGAWCPIQLEALSKSLDKYRPCHDLELPEEVVKQIGTSNPLESSNGVTRRITRAKHSFPNQDSALSYIILQLLHSEERRRRSEAPVSPEKAGEALELAREIQDKAEGELRSVFDSLKDDFLSELKGKEIAAVYAEDVPAVIWNEGTELGIKHSLAHTVGIDGARQAAGMAPGSRDERACYQELAADLAGRGLKAAEPFLLITNYRDKALREELCRAFPAARTHITFSSFTKTLLDKLPKKYRDPVEAGLELLAASADPGYVSAGLRALERWLENCRLNEAKNVLQESFSDLLAPCLAGLSPESLEGMPSEKWLNSLQKQLPKKPGIRQELETLAAELQHMDRLKQEQHWIQAEQSENLKAWAAAL